MQNIRNHRSTHPKHPGNTTDRGSKVGNDASLNSAEVGRKSRSTIETEPAEPEEHCSKDDVGCVVRLVRKTFSAIAAALAEVNRNSQGGSTRANVNRSSSSKIETSKNVRPSVGVPCPAGKRIVDNGCPNENKNEGGSQTTTFSDGTNSESSTKFGASDGKMEIRDVTYVIHANMHW